MTTWTDEEAAKLKELRTKGHAFSDIARRLNKSRNACCARADRDGLKKIAPCNPSKRTIPNREQDERDLDFLDDVAAGVPVRVAGREHGLSIGSAQRMVKEYWDGEPA